MAPAGDVSEVTAPPVIRADLGDLQEIDPGLKKLITYPAKSRAAWGTNRNPSYPDRPLTEALWLCQAHQRQERRAEQLLDRETGCLLAIAERWSSAHMGGQLDQTRLGEARTIYGFAVHVLGTKAKAFLDRALRPGIASAFTERGEPPADLVPWKAVRALSPKLSSPSTLLRLVRDAWASDLAYAAQTMLGYYGTGRGTVAWTDGVANDLVLADFAGAGLLGEVFSREPTRFPAWEDTIGSAASLCIEGFPGGWDVDNGRWVHCATLVDQMWQGYRATGSRAFHDAAVAAYRSGLVVAGRWLDEFRSATRNLDYRY